MLEAGHYYTVYFTSLAVGFPNDVAFKHAMLAQMPDEVESLDAKTLQIDSILRELWVPIAKMRQPFSSIDDVILAPTKWRYLINFAIHSLVDSNHDSNSSNYQTQKTKTLLRSYNSDSLEFGFLLHRLGDNYAHRIMGNENKLYPIKKDSALSWHQGHAPDGVNPDYEYLRPGPFLDYLRSLYDVLNEKVTDPQSIGHYERYTPMPFEKLGNIYTAILKNVNNFLEKNNTRWPNAPRNSGIRKMATTTKDREEFFIQQIREKCMKHLREVINPDYTPEYIQALPLSEFLRKNPGLRSWGINADRIRDAILNLYMPLTELDNKLDKREQKKWLKGYDSFK